MHLGNIKNPSQTKWLSEPVWLYFYNYDHEDLGTSTDLLTGNLLIFLLKTSFQLSFSEKSISQVTGKFWNVVVKQEKKMHSGGKYITNSDSAFHHLGFLTSH